MGDQPHTINSSLAGYSPSTALAKSQEEDRQAEAKRHKAQGILAHLGRLALHYYRPDMIETHAKLIMEDMIEDLLDYDLYEIAQACAAWRRKPDASYFPKSGQLIGCIKNARETSIANNRASMEPFRAPKMIEHDRKPLKPWRQILREHGKLVPE